MTREPLPPGKLPPGELPPGELPPGVQGVPSADDTAAFQRFYLDEPSGETKPSLWHQLFVGWWRRGG